MFYLIKIYIFTGLFLILCFSSASAQSELFRDGENCQMCHRYPTMGVYDKTGEKRIFYISGQKFADSAHGKLRCSNCHIGLDKIPHADIKEIDCSTKCHIDGSSLNQDFSHMNMIKKYEASVHGRGTEQNPKPFPEDLPTCKYCHNNTLEVFGDEIAVLSNETLTGLRRRRSQSKIVKLCASCHEDQKKMARHGIESIDTYKDTFHWELIKYGVENAPDCISCHVPAGYSSHDIRPKSDPLSPINIANRIKTCSGPGGVQTCHPDATDRFATGRVHAYGIKAQLVTGESVFNVEGRFRSLMIEQAKTDIPDEEIFHYRILKILRLFYKILIAGVISFMSLHQLLDYIRARKELKVTRRL